MESIDDLIFPLGWRRIDPTPTPRLKALEADMTRTAGPGWFEAPTEMEIAQVLELARHLEQELIHAQEKINRLESCAGSASSGPLPGTSR
jgi:hypothetical protein